MSDNTDQEKTEQPSEKRLRESREKGDIPRSRDLNAASVTLAVVIMILSSKHSIGSQLAAIVRSGLTHSRGEVFDPQAMLASFANTALQALMAIAPIFIIAVLSALFVPMMFGGWTFSLQPLGFQVDRLNPLSGLGRMFSTRGLVELLKAIAKVLAIGSAMYLLLRQMQPELIKTGGARASFGAETINLVGFAALMLSVALALISLVDVPWQLHSHNKRLRMTRQELRDEYKETEGRPEVKNRIRQLQNQMARRRMMQEVPKADVVITNPTHYAVALRYDNVKMRAPLVVAKGSDLVAAQIRKIATENNVPLLAAPPLARALHFTTEIGAEVPTALYVAVAQVLAWVYRLKQAVQMGDEAPEPPMPEIDPALSDPKNRI